MPELTPREEKMMRLIVGGASNSELADRLGVALRTAELYRAKVMNKLHAKSAAQLGYKYALLEMKRSQVEATPV